MNDHDATTDVPDTAAPLPWSDTESDPPDSSGQAWRPVQPELPLLEIHLSPSAGDRWRCHRRKTWTRPDAIPMILGLGCGWYLIHDWGRYFSKVLLAGRFVVPDLSVILSPFISAFSILIIILLVQSILSAIHVYKTRTSRHSLWSLEVTTEMIRHVSPVKESNFTWKQLRYITLYAGDIYIHGIGLDSAVYIPHTAFPSDESAKRFYAALVALWKSRGRPETVPHEVRAEFAPHTGVGDGPPSENLPA